MVEHSRHLTITVFQIRRRQRMTEAKTSSLLHITCSTKLRHYVDHEQYRHAQCTETMQSCTRLCSYTRFNTPLCKNMQFLPFQPPGFSIADINSKTRTRRILKPPLISVPKEWRLQDLENGNVHHPLAPVWSMLPAPCCVQGWHGWMLELWRLVTRGPASSASGIREIELGLGLEL
jgi:hypothetical protein